MGSFVVVDRSDVGFCVWPEMFAADVKSPVLIEGNYAAANMASFAASYVMKGADFLKVADGYCYFDQGFMSCSDTEGLFKKFSVYMQNLAWLKVEPYIEMGTIEKVPTCEVRAFANVRADALNVAIMTQYKYFVYGVDDQGAKKIVGLFGVLDEEAEQFLATL